MLEPVKSGRDLIQEIDQTLTVTPTLWWLGHSGFVIKFANITFYVDVCLSDPPGRTRLVRSPLAASDVRHADMFFATHGHAGHLDAPSLVEMLPVCRTSKLVLPRSAADAANAAGIPYDRMTTTDAGLRVEYFKDNLYARVYAVPSAHPEQDWTHAGGNPYLGYLIRFGRWTIYHAGDCVMYPELADRLRPFNVNVALVPISDGTFTVSQAARLATDIGASWIVPMHHGTFSADRENEFVEHLLGQRPELRFRVFQCGEKWTVPEE